MILQSSCVVLLTKLWVAHPDSQVIAAGEAYHLYLFAQALQGDEILLALRDGTSEVGLSVKEQDRRIHL